MHKDNIFFSKIAVFFLCLGLFLFLHITFSHRLEKSKQQYQSYYWWFSWNYVVKAQKIYNLDFAIDLYSNKELDFLNQVEKANKIIDLSFSFNKTLITELKPSRDTLILNPLYPFILLNEIIVTSSFFNPYFSVDRVQNFQLLINYFTFIFLFLTLIKLKLNPYIVFAIYLTIIKIFSDLILRVLGPILMINESAFVPLFLSLSIFIFTLYLKTKKQFYLIGLAILLGISTLLRGEFLFLGLFTGMTILLLELKQRKNKKMFPEYGILFFILLFLFPILWGLRNLQLYGIFVTGRTQNWQHFYQNIGEFPNPWGIKNTDEWTRKFLTKAGYSYGTYQADQFLRQKYLAAFIERPDIILGNFYRRSLAIADDYFPFKKYFIIIPMFLLYLVRRVRKSTAQFIPLLSYLFLYWFLMGFIIYGGLIKYVYSLTFLTLAILTVFIYFLISQVWIMIK